ncbi:hypothetical protein QJQ45_022870 [Haematococcus lacustris]|nr:hypothetical protein QJQ45_022870 [Haematococcus lacustris]
MEPQEQLQHQLDSMYILAWAVAAKVLTHIYYQQQQQGAHCQTSWLDGQDTSVKDVASTVPPSLQFQM